MQALTIMLIELASTAHHKAYEKQEDLVKSLKKLFRWLRAMKGKNAMAERAHGIALGMMKRVAARNSDLNIEDIIIEEAPDLGQATITHVSQQGDQYATSLRPRERNLSGDPVAQQFPQNPFSGECNAQQDIADGFTNTPEPYQEQSSFMDWSNIDFFGDNSMLFSSLPSHTGLGNLLYFNFDEQNPIFAPTPLEDPSSTWKPLRDEWN